jgi:DUF4097 and DUF4098 domain-containing protein YvlB
MDSKNRNVWIIVVVALVVLCCCAVIVGAAAIFLVADRSVDFDRDFDWDLDRETQRIDETFEVGATPRLELDSFAGNVTVRVGESDTIRVVATKKARNRSSLDRIDIEWSEGEGELRIQARHSQRTATNMSVEFEITAPAGTRLDLDTGAGNMQIENMTGEIDAHTGAGNIETWGSAGPVSLDTGAGNITYQGKPQGDCTFDTGAGNITLRLSAEVDVEVDLDTGIGSIDVDDFDVVGQVSRGEVRGVIGSGDQGRIEAQTGAGNIDLVRR